MSVAQKGQWTQEWEVRPSLGGTPMALSRRLSARPAARQLHMFTQSGIFLKTRPDRLGSDRRGGGPPYQWTWGQTQGEKEGRREGETGRRERGGYKVSKL